MAELPPNWRQVLGEQMDASLLRMAETLDSLKADPSIKRGEITKLEKDLTKLMKKRGLI